MDPERMVQQPDEHGTDSLHVSFVRFSAQDGVELADMLTEEDWPYHSGQRLIA